MSESGSKYFRHIIVLSGTVKSISDNIIKFLEQKTDLSNLVAIESDGITLNTGIQNGVNGELDKHIGRPLQWFICLLHANELSFCHLMKQYNGETTEPSEFSGEIGKKLSA